MTYLIYVNSSKNVKLKNSILFIILHVFKFSFPKHSFVYYYGKYLNLKQF